MLDVYLYGGSAKTFGGDYFGKMTEYKIAKAFKENTEDTKESVQLPIKKLEIPGKIYKKKETCK